MSPERKCRVMNQSDASKSLDVYSQLLATYSEPHRHYHNRAHIDDRLSRLDEDHSIVYAPKAILEGGAPGRVGGIVA